MENFRFEMTKVYSKIPPPPMENFRFEMTKVYSEIPPQMENFRFEMTKVYSKIPPKMENFRFEITKVYSKIPPIGLESGRSYVKTNLYPSWIPSRLLLCDENTEQHSPASAGYGYYHTGPPPLDACTMCTKEGCGLGPYVLPYF